MGNRVDGNPIYLDTFSTATIRTGPVAIKAIYFETNANNDILVLSDKNGNIYYRHPVTAATIDNGTSYVAPTGTWVVFPDNAPLRADGIEIVSGNGNYDGTNYAVIIV